MNIRFLWLVLILIFCSCERHNVFYENKSNKEQVIWEFENLNFSTHFYHYKGNKLTVNFWISGIKKEYQIDNCSLDLINYETGNKFILDEVENFDGMNNWKVIKSSNFESLPVASKTINSDIKTYYAINHIYIIENMDDIDDYKLSINCQLSNSEEKIVVNKEFLFEREREFLPLPIK